MSSSSARPIRVLIAEDEVTLREALAELLAMDGDIELVGSASDAHEAVALAGRLRPDVALVDVKMPGGGGPSAARGIRAVSPRTRVLALSAYSEWTTILEMLRAGAVGYMVKGAGGISVLEAVRLAASGEAVLSREATGQVIRELVAQLERAERLSDELRTLDRTKSELIQILSHELLTPVSIIQGSVLIVRDRQMTPDALDRLTDGVLRASNRLSRLVRNIEAAAALDRPDEPIAARPVSAAALLDQTASQFPEHRGRLVLPHAADQRVWADADLASKALVAVVENALSFSCDDAPVDVSVEASRFEVTFVVADRGPGVPDGFREHLFQPFTQADASETRSHRGVGIGLYISSRIMAAHRGRIEHAPRVGGGSVFALAFPRVVS